MGKLKSFFNLSRVRIITLSALSAMVLVGLTGGGAQAKTIRHQYTGGMAITYKVNNTIIGVTRHFPFHGKEQGTWSGIQCGTYYNWNSQVWEDGNGTHIELDSGGHFVACSGSTYVDWSTPKCTGFGQCQSPSNGVIGQGESWVNPWYNQTVFYCCPNFSDSYAIRWENNDRGEWRAAVY